VNNFIYKLVQYFNLKTIIWNFKNLALAVINVMNAVKGMEKTVALARVQTPMKAQKPKKVKEVLTKEHVHYKSVMMR